MSQWRKLIEYAEAKLERNRLKTAQLEALITTFRRQAAHGAPCPTEMSDLSKDLS